MASVRCESSDKDGLHRDGEKRPNQKKTYTSIKWMHTAGIFSALFNVLIQWRGCRFEGNALRYKTENGVRLGIVLCNVE